MKNNIDIDNFIPNNRTFKFNVIDIVRVPLRRIGNLQSFHRISAAMGVGMFVIGPLVSSFVAVHQIFDQCKQATELGNNIDNLKQYISHEVVKRELISKNLKTFKETLQTQLTDLQNNIDKQNDDEAKFLQGMQIMITLNVLTFIVLVITKIILNRIKKK
tara:strand:- start:2927 stop:3406 length:480 start_codon:yes stop_codon:yes gene_type:complete